MVVSYYLETKDGLRLKVRVQPKASKNCVDGVVDGYLRIRLTAPPVEGAANEACQKFLAALFGVAKSRVSLLNGAKAREKTFAVAGETSELKERLSEALKQA